MKEVPETGKFYEMGVFNVKYNPRNKDESNLDEFVEIIDKLMVKFEKRD